MIWVRILFYKSSCQEEEEEKQQEVKVVITFSILRTCYRNSVATQVKNLEPKINAE